MTTHTTLGTDDDDVGGIKGGVSGYPRNKNVFPNRWAAQGHQAGHLGLSKQKQQRRHFFTMPDGSQRRENAIIFLNIQYRSRLVLLCIPVD